MSEDRVKITVVGIGGVGGALAAMLLKTFGDDVSLVARGARRQHLLEHGLTIHGDYAGDYTVPCGRVEEDPAVLGVQDIVIMSVKNGNLKQAARQIAPIVGEKTAVVPVMNGVTVYRELAEELGTGIVLPSVIFIVSMAMPDYSIVQKGPFIQVKTGTYPGKTEDREAARKVCEILAKTGIRWEFSEDALAEIWKKYVLNCAYNVVTARWNCDIGAIKADPKRMEDCRLLMEECAAVGRAQGVTIPDEVIGKMMNRIRKTVDEDTSSLSRDFAAGRVGEMDIFSPTVIRLAGEVGVDVPVTREYARGLAERAASFAGKG